MGLQFHSKLEGKRKNQKATMLRFVTLFALVAAVFAEPEAQMVHHPNGAVVPDDTMAVKLARSQHLTAKFGMPLAYSLPYTYTYTTSDKCTLDTRYCDQDYGKQRFENQ